MRGFHVSCDDDHRPCLPARGLFRRRSRRQRQRAGGTDRLRHRRHRWRRHHGRGYGQSHRQQRRGHQHKRHRQRQRRHRYGRRPGRRLEQRRCRVGQRRYRRRSARHGQRLARCGQRRTRHGQRRTRRGQRPTGYRRRRDLPGRRWRQLRHGLPGGPRLRRLQPQLRRGLPRLHHRQSPWLRLQGRGGQLLLGRAGLDRQGRLPGGGAALQGRLLGRLQRREPAHARGLRRCCRAAAPAT